MGSMDMGNISQIMPAAHPFLAICDNSVLHTDSFREAAISKKGGFTRTRKLILVLLGMMFIVLGVNHAQDIRYYYGSSNKPFVLEDENGKSYGYDIDTLREMVKKSGHKLVIIKKQVPWSRSLNDIKGGKVEVLPGASFTKERSEYAYFDIKYRAEYLALYIKKGSAENYKLNSVEDLTSGDFKLGTSLGSTYGLIMDKIIEKMGKRAQPISGNEVVEINRKKVIAGRINAYLDYPASETFSLISDGYDDKIEVHPTLPQVNTGDIYFMLSKKSVKKSTLNDLKKAYEEMQKDGTIERRSCSC